jgi:hypothetical protein
MKKIILISSLLIVALCFLILNSLEIKAAEETPYEGLLHRTINTEENSITLTCNATPWSYRNCSPVGSTITLYQ